MLRIRDDAHHIRLAPMPVSFRTCLSFGQEASYLCEKTLLFGFSSSQMQVSYCLANYQLCFIRDKASSLVVNTFEI